MHGEGWIKGCEASNKVIFEDYNCFLCSVTEAILRGHKLEFEGVLVEEFL